MIFWWFKFKRSYLWELSKPPTIEMIRLDTVSFFLQAENTMFALHPTLWFLCVVCFFVAQPSRSGNSPGTRLLSQEYDEKPSNFQPVAQQRWAMSIMANPIVLGQAGGWKKGWEGIIILPLFAYWKWIGMYISLNSPVGIWYLVLVWVILTCLNKSGWWIQLGCCWALVAGNI